MLNYAEKLTLNPSGVTSEDVDALRSAGFDDEAIGMIAITAALYAFMNRVTDGLGCSLPRGMDKEARRLGLID